MKTYLRNRALQEKNKTLLAGISEETPSTIARSWEKINKLVPERFRTDLEVFRRLRLSLAFSIATSILVFSYVVPHYLMGDIFGAIFLFIISLLLLAPVWFVRFLQKSEHLGHYFSAILSILFAQVAIMQGGSSSPAAVSNLLVVLAAYMFIGLRPAMIWLVIESLFYISLVAMELGGHVFDDVIPIEFRPYDRMSQIVGLLIATIVLFHQSEQDRRRFQRELDNERKRSDALLDNILPPLISARMKSGEASIAEFHESVSVLFADIVGFTEFSSRHSPEHVVDVLDHFFQEFDILTQKYGVEKIKTIGDAYMAVAGAPISNPNHPNVILLLAINMLQSVQNFNKKNNTNFQLRIGIHSGQVVAGVIGLQRLLYDLWGDTVNTASRMESHGESNTIHVTAQFVQDYLRWFHATTSLLFTESSQTNNSDGSITCALSVEQEVVFIPRGHIDVKGKGLMETYFAECVGA